MKNLGRIFVAASAIAVLAAVILLAPSVLAIRGHVDAAKAGYASFETSMASYDFAGALSSITDAANEITAIKDELHSWQWHAATSIPVVGDEVTRAQELSEIAARLSTEALIPVANDAAAVIDVGDVADPLSALAAKAEDVSRLYASLDSARKVVAHCRSDAEGLSYGRFPTLNQAIDTMREAIVQADNTFNQVALFFDTVDAIGAIADSVS